MYCLKESRSLKQAVHHLEAARKTWIKVKDFSRTFALKCITLQDRGAFWQTS